MKKRPVNLDLFTIKFPSAAIASILHRMSGVILFFAIPIFLYALDISLQSEDGFTDVNNFFNSMSVKIIVWIMLCALIYHLIAGIRHLIMDFCHIGEGKYSGKVGAYIVFVLSLLLIVIFSIGYWL
tara:strand:+ start:25682 stop:26059 length:378 start_codon:yes stop_codon:yes gene_type:complete